jgi:amino acid adenylation domain-containing protein
MTKQPQVEDIIGLSPVQIGILREITSGARQPRNGRKAYKIHGAVDVSRFQEAWKILVAQTAILRSSVHWEGLEKPVRVVRKGQEATQTCCDWKHVPVSGLKGRILQELRAQERAISGFEDTGAVHAILAQVAANESVLICIFQRLLLDEWSMNKIVHDLFRIYEHPGDHPAGAKTTDKFKAYLGWVNANAERSQDFWHGYLHKVELNGAGITAGMPGNASDVGHTDLVEADLQDGPAVRFLAEHGEPQFRALVYAAWALLLQSHFSREEPIFGVAASGREAGFEAASEIKGPLSVLLPFRAAIPDRTPVAVWLASLQKQWQGMASHAHVVPENEAGHQKPLFDTAVLFPGNPLQAGMKISGAEVSVREVPLPSAARYPLVLSIRLETKLSLEISSDGSFDPEVLQRLLSHFTKLLEALSAEPGRMCAAVPVMPMEEQDRLLEWSEGAAWKNVSQCIHEAFETQVKHLPDAVAAICETRNITYRQLNACANQLAGYLRKSGVGPEVVVAVFMERCLETLVAVLAISKAGGMYLPLAPELPQDRISFLLRDANPAVVLTLGNMLSSLPLAMGKSEIFSFDTDWEVVTGLPTDDLEALATPECGAYIIYTSGSTGEPKGVVVSQGAAVNHLLVVAETFGYRPQDRVLQFAALSFDVSIEQLLAPLFRGASVVLKSNAVWNQSDFFCAIREFGITVANVPPAFWVRLLENEDEKEDSSAQSLVRLMIVGGDTMPQAALADWQHSPNWTAGLLNAYGPTEAVITATVFRVPQDLVGDEQRVPIGRPLSGRKAYVVANGRLAPIQMWGELYLGGSMLARGYLNRPDLTAERFVPDVFSGEPGARLYRSGDIGRYLDDGHLDFLGRADSQVKIRGFRIELGEIEHALARHPDVRQAVVIARELQENDKRLVAYVVSRTDAPPSATELRDFLRLSLPEYMLPSSIGFLASLPLTDAGKVDRRALPPISETIKPVADDVPSADLTSMELTLMGIWSDLLGVKQMTVQDDFFELGGDSLLATQVVSRIQKAFAVEIPLRVMFDSPTIAALVREIEERGGSAVEEPALVRVVEAHEHPLSPAQERLWFVCREMGQSSAYNMTGAIQFEGFLDISLLEEALTMIVGRHEALRTVFPFNGDHPVQAILASFPITLSINDLANLPEHSREAELWRLLDRESELPFDLVSGPVFRAQLLRLSGQRHVLLSTLHHIAGDGWSLRILAKEIGLIYGTLLRGERSPLPDLSVRYVDFVHWQKRLLEIKRREHLDFWTRRLGGCPAPLPLPQEKSAGTRGTSPGANYAVNLSRGVSEALSRLGREHNATLFMVLLAAWKTLLSAYSGAEDIVVGTDIANRSHAETEEIIGFFVNVLALRTDLSGNPSFSDLLDRVRETTVGAYQHQDFPFNQLLQIVNPGQSNGPRVLFKTFFHLLTGKLEIPQVRGLRVTILEPDDRTAKFDLSLRIAETEEGIICRFNYATELFDEHAIRQIGEDYQRLVEHVAENSSVRLSTLKTMVASGIVTPGPGDSFKRFMTAGSRS